MKTFLLIFFAFTLTSASFATRLKGKWIGDSGSYLNWHLDFKKPGQVELVFEHMDGAATMPARYEIGTNNMVNFFDFGVLQGDLETSYVEKIRTTLSAGKCSVINTGTSLTHLWGLSCLDGKEKFWDTTRLVSAGLKRKVGELDVVTMGVRNGKTITCTRLRSMPSTESSLVEYLPEDQSGAKNCAPTGTPLMVLARTLAQEKVGKTQNFWYFVSIGHQQQAWVFGNLIKF